MDTQQTAERKLLDEAIKELRRLKQPIDFLLDNGGKLQGIATTNKMTQIINDYDNLSTNQK
jgi:sRNA-binding regulator protein Hfq